MPVFRQPPLYLRLLFAAAIFGGSFLLFVIQPFVARLALPLLGGAPAVWNSAMVVFQILLLAGYLYAHLLARMPIKRQFSVHLALLLLSAFTLPIALAELPEPVPGWQVLWVPALITATIGPVFFLLSAQSSLIQRWYGGIEAAGDPYRLYAISNIGSFAGLIAYPFLIEPRLNLATQGVLWAIGFALVGCLVGAIAALRWRLPDAIEAPQVAIRAPRLAKRRIALWIALAAVPSGLTLSTTTLLTTDLMAMPLLWVIPLSLYLLSFSIAFTDTGHWHRILSIYAPILLLLVGGLAMISGGQSNPAIALAMVALLFVLSVALHARLYALRPAPRRLTFFYLMVAVGGASGGIFVALIAPVLFDWVYEHALLLLMAGALCAHRPLLPFLSRIRLQRWQSSALILVALTTAAVLAWLLGRAVAAGRIADIFWMAMAIMVVGLFLIGRRAAYTATLAMLMLGLGGFLTLQASFEGNRSRSYFGVYSVERTEGGRLRQLTHGTTMHGEQWLVEGREYEPTAYYGRSAGVGLALEAAGSDARVGVVGLGVGTLACYRKPGQEWTFYEIDPEIARYSRKGVFTFVEDCAPNSRIVIGDARIRLGEEPDDTFDVLVVDAFSSDAIPLHLLTREAFAGYRRVLEADGLLLVHISNRFIDLEPTISAIAGAMGWSARLRSDEPEGDAGLTASDWIVLAADEERLTRLSANSGEEWTELAEPNAPPITDDNASLLSLFRF